MTNRPRCVVDTNVLISAGISPAGTARIALDWILAHGRLLWPEHTLEEFRSRFIQRGKFDRYASVERRVAFVADVIAHGERIGPTTRLAVCRDPDDDRFLELAVDGRAECIVTGNTKDFPREHAGIPVLTPAEFVQRYAERGEPVPFTAPVGITTSASRPSSTRLPS